jgi:hypothetical protein
VSRLIRFDPPAVPQVGVAHFAADHDLIRRLHVAAPIRPQRPRKARLQRIDAERVRSVLALEVPNR